MYYILVQLLLEKLFLDLGQESLHAAVAKVKSPLAQKRANRQNKRNKNYSDCNSLAYLITVT